MISEELLYKGKGEIRIYEIKGDSRKLLYKGNNAIVANAKKILVHAAGGDGFIIDKIGAYKAAVLLSYQTLFTVTYPAGDDKVKFVARFDEASFDDTLDEVRLESSSGGIFSIFTGLSHTKDNTTQLEVQWLITINNF